MAKNEKKVSINQFENIMKERFPQKTTEQWFDIEVTIRHSLPFAEMLAFANDVVVSCFSDSYGFMPELMDFAVRSNILTRYANFTMPDNLEKRYEFIYNTDAVDFVLGHINMDQLKELISAINRKIEYQCSTNINYVQKHLTELVAAFEQMQKNTEEMFGGINPDDFSKVVNAIAEHGSVDEKKIVDAVMANRAEAAAMEKEQVAGMPLVKGE